MPSGGIKNRVGRNKTTDDDTNIIVTRLQLNFKLYHYVYTWFCFFLIAFVHYLYKSRTIPVQCLQEELKITLTKKKPLMMTQLSKSVFPETSIVSIKKINKQ